MKFTDIKWAEVNNLCAICIGGIENIKEFSRNQNNTVQRNMLLARGVHRLSKIGRT